MIACGVLVPSPNQRCRARTDRIGNSRCGYRLARASATWYCAPPRTLSVCARSRGVRTFDRGRPWGGVVRTALCRVTHGCPSSANDLALRRIGLRGMAVLTIGAVVRDHDPSSPPSSVEDEVPRLNDVAHRSSTPDGVRDRAVIEVKRLPSSRCHQSYLGGSLARSSARARTHHVGIDALMILLSYNLRRRRGAVRPVKPPRLHNARYPQTPSRRQATSGADRESRSRRPSRSSSTPVECLARPRRSSEDPPRRPVARLEGQRLPSYR